MAWHTFNQQFSYFNERSIVSITQTHLKINVSRDVETYKEADTVDRCKLSGGLETLRKPFIVFGTQYIILRVWLP
jgi:hypothetical protein